VCGDTAGCWHCCTCGVDQRGDDKQSVVSGGVSVSARYVSGANANPRSGAIPAQLLRWAAVLDLFGYYLAMAVLAYVLWRQLRPRNPLVADLSTLAAVGYGLALGLGAALLAMVARMLMHNYTDTAVAGQVGSSGSCLTIGFR
jgi:hypothetical protein